MDKKLFFKVMKVLVGIGLLAIVVFLAFIRTEIKTEKINHHASKKPLQKPPQLQSIQQAPAKQNEKVLQEKKAVVKKEAVKAVVKKTAAKPAQQLFPAEKILTISAFEYCENHGKSIKDYKIVGVHGYGGYLFYRKDLLSGSAERYHHSKDYIVNLFIHRIPSGTEVVVGLAYSSADDVASGVALIPKPKSKKQTAIKPARKK